MIDRIITTEAIINMRERADPAFMEKFPGRSL